MQFGEAIAIGRMDKQFDEKCPFKDNAPGVSEMENEMLAGDDRNSVQAAQANSGGKLGENLTDASNGTPGTWKSAPYPPPDAEKKPPIDSKRNNGGKLKVVCTPTIKEGEYPYTVAAHHLIPGNASLYNGDNPLQDYMIKGKDVKAAGKTWKIKHHIGYNVNGAHNGVWLPGNYAIRAGSSPTGVTWGSMGNEDWQLNYVAASAKAARGQFHDAHTDYSDAVLKLLKKIAAKLRAHQCKCEECKAKSEPLPPPYEVKDRLYKLSKYFRRCLVSSPANWRRPWFASDRWRDVVFSFGATKPCDAFQKAYNEST